MKTHRTVTMTLYTSKVQTQACNDVRFRTSSGIAGPHLVAYINPIHQMQRQDVAEARRCLVVSNLDEARRPVRVPENLVIGNVVYRFEVRALQHHHCSPTEMTNCDMPCLKCKEYQF